ncbi:MAG TPA: cupin domain-containing protein [Acetobacteraceae bacterium]
MKIAITLAATLMAPLAYAADAPMKMMHSIAKAEDVQWHDAAMLPKGAQIAILAGDPSKAESFVLRLKLPEGYEVPAHQHPGAENVTVLSGAFNAGMGDKLDTAKGQVFEPGGFVAMPAQMNHFAWATEPTVIQIHGEGPFEIIYVNPADDPSKAQ